MTHSQTVEFDIAGELAAIGGIALISCWGPDGEPITAYAYHGEIKPIEIIGLLTTALDQYRYNFVDRDYDVLEDDDEEEEDL